MFLAVGVHCVFNDSALSLGTLQDLKSNNKRGKRGECLLWKWNVSFLPAGKRVCAMSMHIFQMMMMKERFKSTWRWKRCLCSSLDSLLSIQVSFTHSSPLLYTSLPPCCPHTSIFNPPPPLSCQIPASMAQWSHLLPETSTNRITMMLKGLWWGNWDKSVKFCSGCCTAPTRTNWFPRSKSHSQHSGT